MQRRTVPSLSATALRWPWRRGAVCLALGLLLAACAEKTDEAGPAPARPATAARVAPPPAPLVAAARAQIGVTRLYDPAYAVLAYPGGDVPRDRGVCTDVVIRALRRQGLDLQQAIHEDMRANFTHYPQQWGMRGRDRNIDHRRVPNQMRWFERQGWQLAIGERAQDYRAGDIVAWRLRGNDLLHVGIVSDHHGHGQVPLILHNIGAGTQEDDLLFQHPIIGHYRPALP